MYFFTFKPFKHAKFIFFPRRNPIISDKGVGENVDLAPVGAIRKGTIITACRCRIKNKLTEYLVDVLTAKKEGRDPWETWQEKLPTSYFERRWGAAWKDNDKDFWDTFKASLKSRKK